MSDYYKLYRKSADEADKLFHQVKERDIAIQSLEAEIERLRDIAKSAAATLGAMYQWIDMVRAAGGATSIGGVAKCHAFLTSMEKNRDRCEDLVMKPLRSALGTKP